jgi:membrane protease YdiL (CAAX protease family)
MVFAWFIQYDFPYILISLAALVPAAMIFSRNLLSWSSLRIRIGDSATFTNSLIFTFVGIISGILVAMFYRWYLGIELFPRSLHSFVIVAAMIGGLEEILFRGFIQEQVKEINGLFSILFSSISHAGYKCFLFLSPMAASGIDVVNLGIWTFLFGIIFGTVKHYSKSIIPSLVAHILFDILVYAEFIQAPWWVW